MKVGIIGCGAISYLHADAIKKQGTQIVALCDVKEEKAHLLKQKYNKSAVIFKDYKELINSGTCDVVHICTPHYLHAEMAIYALERDTHVFLEKPACINRKELKSIKSAALKSRARLAVCFQNRYLESYLAVKEYLKGKTILGISASVLWSRDEAYYVNSGWRGQKKTEGGGVLINQAIHTLDIVQWLGGFAEYVTANILNCHLKKLNNVEDIAEIYLECKGHNIFFYATTAASRNYPIEIKIDLGSEIVEIIGDKAFINGKEINISQNNSVIQGKEYWGIGHYNIIDKFYSSIEKNDIFMLDIFEGGKTLETLFSIYSSNGKRIKVKYGESQKLK